MPRVPFGKSIKTGLKVGGATGAAQALIEANQTIPKVTAGYDTMIPDPNGDGGMVKHHVLGSVTDVPVHSGLEVLGDAASTAGKVALGFSILPHAVDAAKYVGHRVLSSKLFRRK